MHELSALLDSTGHRFWACRQTSLKVTFSGQVGASLALYKAAHEHGVSRAEAAALVETIMTDLYRPVPAAMFKRSRLRSAKREVRIRWIAGMITRHFLPAPPFCYRHLPSQTGVAFDVTACPFADYFNDQGVPELTEPAAGAD